MACIQLLRVAYYAVTYCAKLILAESVASAWIAFAQGNVTLVTDAYSLLGSVFLFVIRYATDAESQPPKIGKRTMGQGGFRALGDGYHKSGAYQKEAKKRQKTSNPRGIEKVRYRSRGR